MGVKENILKDIPILINHKFKSPEEEFTHFDTDKVGCLNREEVKALSKETFVSKLLRGVVAGEMIKAHDKSGGDTINKDEFKVAMAELDSVY